MEDGKALVPEDQISIFEDFGAELFGADRLYPCHKILNMETAGQKGRSRLRPNPRNSPDIVHSISGQGQKIRNLSGLHPPFFPNFCRTEELLGHGIIDTQTVGDQR